MTKQVVEVTGLTKNYGTHTAVDQISFSVREGEIFGLLGPNGAGKTTTLILSTHDMAEAEEMADRVAILLRGRIAATGTPRELTAGGNGLTKISVHATGTELGHFPGVTRESGHEDYRIYYTAETGPVVAAIIARIQNTGGTLIDLRVERPSLEERFLELTNKEAC